MDKSADPLATYNRKRDFARTAEPKSEVERSKTHGPALFMVQKHDATRLHYDLRLELDGVMKSWAVPNGPSLNPADKRLAVRTEDHPMSYATFEGTIPKGEYGGGTVMLWDWGRWTPDPRKDARKTLEEGHLHFTLDGHRMKGEWVMFRLKPKGRERAESWMLKKVTDAQVGGSMELVETYLTSIKTGRTMQEIAAGKKAKELKGWKTVPRRRPGPSPEKKLGSGLRRNTGIPAFRQPQKATLVDYVPPGSAWIHEMKYDGYRCLLGIGGGQARIYTRSGLDWSDKFPDIVAAARELEVGSALLDGEIVKLDEAGNTGFSALQQGISGGGRGLTLFLFDALEIDGEDLAGLANIERKGRLATLLGPGKPPALLYAEHIVGHGEELYRAMCEAGQEGIISKKASSPYRGARTKSWLKVKCTLRQEFVIIGWSTSDKKGRGFRSLLLGTHEDGKLRYAGKVGTGFSNEVQHDLRERFERLARDKPAVAVPRADARGAHWVKPELVCEIAFAEFTSEGILRHPSFLGLRSDKKAKEVVLELPQPLPAAATAAPGDDVKISNPERVLWPEAGVTKQELVDYYREVGPLMTAWAARRPLSLVRCPQGRARKCFFQKHNTATFGPHVRQVEIEEKKGEVVDYVYVEDVAGIIACVQMGTIEFHGWGSPVDDIEKPDRLIFDIDPDVGLSFAEVKRTARDLHRYLADMGLVSFPLTTGGKGLHVVVPLTPDAEWPQVKDFAQRFCVALATAQPERFTANLAKAKRKGRIFLDYLRNQRGSTAILPYSARARDNATVSAPITWDELEDLEGGNIYTVRDSDLLLERASGRALQGWGEASQVLPDL
ncbi:DNA ligase D [Allosphingosinicella sp.]|uniref:DNA ligase D n=1 Tax=Allosphingosinicella sp. TaxID=2823234 RepID=UPI002F087E9B